MAGNSAFPMQHSAGTPLVSPDDYDRDLKQIGDNIGFSTDGSWISIKGDAIRDSSDVDWITSDGALNTTLAGSLSLPTGTTVNHIEASGSGPTIDDNTLWTSAQIDAHISLEDLDFAGDSGTGAVDLDSQTFTLAGTANEIVTSASGQTLTIALPDDVTIGSDLTVTDSLVVGTTSMVVNASGYSGKTGFGTATPDGTLHAHTASAGSVTADIGADDLVVENSTTGGISILTPNTQNGNIYFGDPDSNLQGFVQYLHASDSLQIGANAMTAITIDNAKKVTLAGAVDVTGLLSANGGITIPTTKDLILGADSDITQNNFTVAGLTGNVGIGGDVAMASGKDIRWATGNGIINTTVGTLELSAYNNSLSILGDQGISIESSFGAISIDSGVNLLLKNSGNTIATVDNNGITIPTTKNLVMVSDSDILVNTDKFTVAGLTGLTHIDSLTASQLVKTDASKNLTSTVGTVPSCQPLCMYDAEPARGSVTNWNGGLLSLATAQPLDSVPTDLVVTKGIGKLLIVINAGSDLAGDITITGESIDRNTGASTLADTDTITVDALTTDNSTTDSNGNVVPKFTGAYISSKWFTGTVTLSTVNLTLTDVDVYHLSFEQFNDNPNMVINTFDANIFTTNVNAEFDAYLYTIHVTGDKANIHNEAELHVGADGETAIANKYWRLRRGNLAEAIDGTTDGTWTDIHYSNSPVYVEDVTIKLWATETSTVILS